MGFLKAGSPLAWTDSLKHVKYAAHHAASRFRNVRLTLGCFLSRRHVRKHGVKQFLNIFKVVKDRRHDVLRWGDEVRVLWCACTAPLCDLLACTDRVPRCSS